MKFTAKLTEDDLRRLLADHFEVDPKQVTLHYTAAMQDGPHHSPASFSATAAPEPDIDAPAAPAVSLVGGPDG